MQVTLIAPPWLAVPPASYGGTEAVVDTLARGLAAEGHDVHLITTGDSTCPVPRSWLYPRSRMSELGNPMVELRHVLYGYGVAADAAIVHDHTEWGPVVAARKRRRHVVATRHGPFTPEARAVYGALGDVAIVAISHHQASTATDVPIARVIHHGLDASRYLVGRGDGGYLLFLGRMSPTKGVRQAIEIARRAGVPLRIAAKMREPDEHAYFTGVVAPLLGHGAEYVGEVSDAEKQRLLGGAMALLNPIAWPEPFGLCMIEAFACGTPVIATPCGAVPEIVEDGVTGFIASDAAGMARAVRNVAGLDREACRRAVETRFSARRMVADHVRLYEDVLDGLDRGRPHRRTLVTGVR